METWRALPRQNHLARISTGNDESESVILDRRAPNELPRLVQTVVISTEHRHLPVA